MVITDLTIRRLGPKGDGVHEGSRGPVYVDRAIPGDRIKARIHKDEQGVARGEILEIVEPSPYRQPAPCPHYDRCGNCTLQHLREGFYREWKVQVVREALRKQGVQPRQWRETVFIGDRNRRRATFAVVKQRGKILMGYYRRRSRQISDIDSCLIADPRLMTLRELTQPLLVPILKEGTPTDVFFQVVGEAADMVITGPVGRRGEPDAAVREAMGRILEASPVTRISWRAGEREPIQPIAKKGRVVGSFGKLKVDLPPAAFLQPTPEGEKALVEAVMGALPPEGRFADLFSGCGTFTGAILERGPVDAYESAPSMVNALSKASTERALRVFRRDLFRHPLRRDEINRYDAVVFDPPRAGCGEQAEAMASARTRTLIGVSCNPATFARDARILCGGGYRLQTVQIVDQFLWSHHVELVGVLTKR